MTEHRHDWQIYYSSQGIGYYECKTCRAKGYSHWKYTDGKVVEGSSKEKRDDE